MKIKGRAFVKEKKKFVLTKRYGNKDAEKKFKSAQLVSGGFCMNL